MHRREKKLTLVLVTSEGFYREIRIFGKFLDKVLMGKKLREFVEGLFPTMSLNKNKCQLEACKRALLKRNKNKKKNP